MNAIEQVMNSLAGLGILFFGIKMVTRNLGAVAGSKLRARIGRVSRRPLSAIASGAALGFVSQSGRTTSFILASFVHAGVIEPRFALTMVLWANLGCTLVIAAAVFPIHLLALFVLALSGAAIAFEKPRPMLKSASAVFGLAMMLFGLRMMSQAAMELTGDGTLSASIGYMKSSLPLAFLFGTVLTFITQSHMAIMLIAVAMASQGIFGLPETLMMVFGTHVGSSLITWLTGFTFHGEARQMVWAEILYNIVVVILFLAFFAVDQLLFEGAGLAWLATRTGLNAGLVSTGVVIAANALGPLVLTALKRPYLALCARLSPTSPEEELGHPKYLHNDMTESPHTVLMLAEMEQLRLLQRLPAYTRALHEGDHSGDGPTTATFHEAFELVAGVIERTQAELMVREMSEEDTEWLLNQQKRQEALHGLESACYDLWANARELEPELLEIRRSIVAEVDALLACAVDGMQTDDPEDFAQISDRTRDCGERMEQLRHDYLVSSDHHPSEERSHILALTSVFERVAFSTSRFSALLQKRPALAG